MSDWQHGGLSGTSHSFVGSNQKISAARTNSSDWYDTGIVPRRTSRMVHERMGPGHPLVREAPGTCPSREVRRRHVCWQRGGLIAISFYLESWWPQRSVSSWRCTPDIRRVRCPKIMLIRHRVSISVFRLGFSDTFPVSHSCLTVTEIDSQILSRTPPTKAVVLPSGCGTDHVCCG